MSKSTRASIAPDKVGVNFTLHSYDYDRDAERVGLQAAEALGIEPRRLLKTLMVEVDGKPACASVVGQRPTSDVPFVPARGTPRRSRRGDPVAGTQSCEARPLDPRWSSPPAKAGAGMNGVS
jgi:hypothetical protein